MTTATASYVEKDCVFRSGRHSAEAGGAIVTDKWAIGYPGAAGVMNDWHGRPIGRWESVASWPIQSWMGDRMHQIEATIDGVTYTGRGFGESMIWRGRVKKGGAA